MIKLDHNYYCMWHTRIPRAKPGSIGATILLLFYYLYLCWMWRYKKVITWCGRMSLELTMLRYHQYHLHLKELGDTIIAQVG